MEEQLRSPATRVVGTKQVLRAIKDGRALAVFLAADADAFIHRQVQSLCEENHVSLHMKDSMQELGKLCLVGVKTAAAAVIK